MEPEKRSVVAADSEPCSRRGLVMSINEHPMLMVCAETGSTSQARDLCIRHQPAVLVLDVAEPGSLALIKDLPSWTPETRVVVYTDRDDAETVQRALRAGALGCVSRRDPITAILAAIIAALHGERYLGPQASQSLLGHVARGGMQLPETETAQLSQREMDVFTLLGRGVRTGDIARELSMSAKTVETHRQRIRRKLGIDSGAELMRRAVLFSGSTRSPS